ncbi:hypothetical protein D3C76_1870070 [compost metagenome]
MGDKAHIVNRLRIDALAQLIAHDISDAVDQLNLLVGGAVVVLAAGVDQMKGDIYRLFFR